MESSWGESVTRWIVNVMLGDEEGARRSWERYFERVTRVARHRMSNVPRREGDEDVTLSESR